MAPEANAASDLWTEWSGYGSDGRIHVKVVHLPSGQEAAAVFDPDVRSLLEVRGQLIADLTVRVEGTSIPRSLPETEDELQPAAPQEHRGPVPEGATLDQAAEHWKALLEPVTEELADTSSYCTRTEYTALVAVRELLFTHPPYINEDLSTGLWCFACGDVWPCGVYRVIEKARYGDGE